MESPIPQKSFRCFRSAKLSPTQASHHMRSIKKKEIHDTWCEENVLGVWECLVLGVSCPGCISNLYYAWSLRFSLLFFCWLSFHIWMKLCTIKMGLPIGHVFSLWVTQADLRKYLNTGVLPQELARSWQERVLDLFLLRWICCGDKRRLRTECSLWTFPLPEHCALSSCAKKMEAWTAKLGGLWCENCCLG